MAYNYIPPPAVGPPNPDLHVHQQQVFGVDAKLHPITGLVVEQGSGALPPDEQALFVHVPYILKTQGKAAADAMLLKLSGKECP
jgi:hypothetical protein